MIRLARPGVAHRNPPPSATCGSSEPKNQRAQNVPQHASTPPGDPSLSLAVRAAIKHKACSALRQPVRKRKRDGSVRNVPVPRPAIEREVVGALFHIREEGRSYPRLVLEGRSGCPSNATIWSQRTENALVAHEKHREARRRPSWLRSCGRSGPQLSLCDEGVESFIEAPTRRAGGRRHAWRRAVGRRRRRLCHHLRPAGGRRRLCLLGKRQLARWRFGR